MWSITDVKPVLLSELTTTFSGKQVGCALMYLLLITLKKVSHLYLSIYIAKWSVCIAKHIIN